MVSCARHVVRAAFDLVDRGHSAEDLEHLQFHIGHLRALLCVFPDGGVGDVSSGGMRGSSSMELLREAVHPKFVPVHDAAATDLQLASLVCNYRQAVATYVMAAEQQVQEHKPSQPLDAFAWAKDTQAKMNSIIHQLSNEKEQTPVFHPHSALTIAVPSLSFPARVALPGFLSKAPSPSPMPPVHPTFTVEYNSPMLGPTPVPATKKRAREEQLLPPLLPLPRKRQRTKFAVASADADFSLVFRRRKQAKKVRTEPLAPSRPPPYEENRFRLHCSPIGSVSWSCPVEAGRRTESGFIQVVLNAQNERRLVVADVSAALSMSKNRRRLLEVLPASPVHAFSMRVFRRRGIQPSVHVLSFAGLHIILEHIVRRDTFLDSGEHKAEQQKTMLYSDEVHRRAVLLLQLLFKKAVSTDAKPTFCATIICDHNEDVSVCKLCQS
jgi:hypothetical protein